MRLDLFSRILGLSPGQRCNTDVNCPAVLELNDGNFAVIGGDKTEELHGLLPPGAGCAPTERIVVIPREVLLRAKADIPDA
jgi:hypothetical protein